MSASRLGSWIVAALAFFSAGCATSYNPTPYWTLHENQFAELKRGVTTKADVRRVIGVPLSEMHFPRLDEEVWEYRYLEGATVRMLAYVHFDAKGVYTYADHMLDPAYQSGLLG